MPILGPSLGPVIGAPVAGVIAGGGGDSFNPASLFAGGKKGFVLDLSMTTGLYQDSARTTPVTTLGQPIGSPSDISGNGAHPIQATAGARPTWQEAARFDGVNDAWATPAIDFTGTDKMTVVVSVRPNASAGAAAILAELSATTVSNTGSWHVAVPNNATGAINAARRGSGTRGDRSTPAITLPDSLVISTTFDLAGATQDTECPYIRVNMIAQALTNGGSADSGGGNFGNYQVFIGARGGTTLPYSGDLFRMIVIGGTMTAVELSQSEAWCAAPPSLFF